MIRKYWKKIRNAGFFMLAITFMISTLWGPAHAFFPMLATVILIGIVVIFKALHWKEFEKDNKRNAWIALALFVYWFMSTFFPI